jgi:hypothetical protein
MSKPTKGTTGKSRATKGPSAASETRAPRVTLAPGRIVYAVILQLPADISKAVLKRLRDLNPDAVEGRPVVYIGETGLSADKRVYNHCVGRQASRWVQRYAQRLIRLDGGPADFGHPLPSPVLDHIADLAARSVEDSKIREKAVAELLRKQGWWVVCA